jgi:hypothetical protein
VEIGDEKGVLFLLLREGLRWDVLVIVSCRGEWLGGAWLLLRRRL